MSIGNNHIVTIFISGKSEALDETQRLAVITRKNTDKTRAANGGMDLVSECVSIPEFSLSNDQILGLRDFVQEMVETAQDSLIRSLVDKGSKVVSDEQITFDSIVSHMMTQNAGAGLKAANVNTWYLNNVHALAREYLAPSSGIDLDNADGISEADALKLEQKCRAYQAAFASVAGRNTLVREDNIAKLEKMLDALQLNDVTARKIRVKLGAMKMTHTQLIL